MKLAIVGSTSFVNPGAFYVASVLIRHYLTTLKPELVISGGAEGIDQLAEHRAEIAKIPTRIFLPKNKRWAPDGFKDRNELIADGCDALIAVRCRHSQTYGSGWTADRAEERLGRSNVERIYL